MTTFSVLSLPVFRSLHVEHVFKRVVVLRFCKVHACQCPGVINVSGMRDARKRCVSPSVPNGCHTQAGKFRSLVTVRSVSGQHASRFETWGAVRKNIISDRFNPKTAISAHI